MVDAIHETKQWTTSRRVLPNSSYSKTIFKRFSTKAHFRDIQEVTDSSGRLEAAFLSAVAVLYGNQTISGIVGQVG